MSNELQTKVIKPGYKTTEFWSMCGVQITAFIVALTSSDTTSIIMSGATAFGSIIAYIWTRHQMKMTIVPLLLIAVLSFPAVVDAQHHHNGGGVRINFGFGFYNNPYYYYQPRPYYYYPVPAPVPAPYTITVDPQRPVYPTLPIYYQNGIYYQVIP